MSSNELYDLYKDAGQVPTEILTNGILAVTCFSGITLNMLLVYVTFKSKSLHSTCNILIAFYAFSISFLLIGDSVPFFVFLFGINFISLHLCFYIQIIPFIFAAFAISLQLCIGIDRLVGISFPIWYKMGGSGKLFKMFITICCAKTVFYDLFLYYYGCLNHWEKPVMCSIADSARQPEINSIATISNLIIYSAEFICYVLMWLVNHFRNKNNEQFTETENNKRLMISLGVIMSIGLICYIGTSLFFNFIMPLLGLNFLTIEYIVWPICNGLASMACSSCTPVLFLCSTDYRKAFCKYLCRTEHHVTVVVPLRIMPASNIRA